MEVGLSALDAVDRLIALLQERLEKLAEIIRDAKSIIDNFPAALATTGVHYLVMEGAGVDGVVEELQAAVDKPDIGEGSLSMGVVVCGGAAGVNTFKEFFSL